MKNKIYKIVLIVSLMIIFCIALSGCGNRDIWDTNYTFDKAIVILNDGTKMEIEIEQWHDYDGEQLQIIGKDGKIYLVSSYNTILIRENKK